MGKYEPASRTYHDMSKRYPEVIAALDNLGTTVRNIGPLDEKYSHLIQLSAAAATNETLSVCIEPEWNDSGRRSTRAEDSADRRRRARSIATANHSRQWI